MNWLENGYTMYGQDAEAEHVAYPRVIKSHLPLKVLPLPPFTSAPLVQKLTGFVCDGSNARAARRRSMSTGT